MQNDSKISLDDAYALKTPADNVALYRHWAETYDVEFAQNRGYQYPKKIADIYAHYAKPDDNPILDVGSGTGLVGAVLQEHQAINAQLTIDGVDISPEMLAISRTKKVYRHLYEADLTQSIDLPENQYGAVVSAGTFTHGHVGPEGINTMLDAVRPQGWVVFSVNATHYQAAGFADKMAQLKPFISDYSATEARIYGPKATAPYADDMAILIAFRKA